ncbi:unnamed protein product [Hydatigera taeniaeformis]|uniref:Lactamase_B domain-containing protein n=1 Tax=Hydatigena taeniaeformis TaxID=6205 RepID=A0A0R3X2G0_HYDTA|nr:unnamed protein product [Hydatigera taeniaeformis]
MMDRCTFFVWIGLRITLVAQGLFLVLNADVLPLLLEFCIFLLPRGGPEKSGINDVQFLCDCGGSWCQLNGLYLGIFTDESNVADGSDLYTDALDAVKDIDWSMIDAVLVSNSQSLIMLPYITEMPNFRGKVLTSGPVLSLSDSRRWLLRYTKDQAITALSRVQTLAYHEYVSLFGLIKVKCVSAGYEIGSSNWVLKTDTEKLVYMSRSSLYPSFSMPMDFSEFSDVDVLMIGAVNTSDSIPFEVAMGYFKTITVQTLARGSHVMIPTLPSGLIYHLLEAVALAKEEFDGNLLSEFDRPVSASAARGTTAGGGSDKAIPKGGVSLVGKVANSPCLFISTQAKASLAYANASGEWLAADRESALYVADSPFFFDMWIRNHHLATLASLHSTPGQVNSGDSGRRKRDSSAWAEGGFWSSYPTVFLSSHPSCRLGPAVHLIRALSLGSSRQRPPQQQQQQQQCPNTNALILVQSDEFCRGKLNGHQKLRQVLEPLKSFGEVGTDWSEDETILGLPVHRLGVGLTAFWLPLRPDISIAELPTLLANCSPPKQALVVPLEVCRGAKVPLPPVSIFILSEAARGIGWRQSLDIELATPSMVRVHVETEVLSSRCAFAMAATPANTTTTNSATGATSASAAKDPRRARDTPTHVALVEGRLCFRDGKYRLESLEPDGSLMTSERGMLGRPTTSPPPSPKRSSSPSPSAPTSSPRPTCASEAVGVYRLLLAKTSTMGGVTVDANQLVKHLTESGVTGAQVIADATLLDAFLTTHRHLHRRLPSHLLPPTAATAKNTALVVFPNSMTTILLTEGSSHITCQDEGTRMAIRNSLLACSPHMLAVPSAVTSATSGSLH